MGKTSKKNTKKENPEPSGDGKAPKKKDTPEVPKDSFACEWKNCNFSCKIENEMYDHVKNHFPKIEIVDGELLICFSITILMTSF